MPSFVTLSRLLIVALLGFFTGCADGPIPALATMNPWLRNEWAEDEKIAPTFFQKKNELARIRTSAKSYSPEKRQQLVTQIATRYREENSRVLRAELIRTLGAFPGASAEETLLVAATDPDPDVRRLACEGLSGRNTAESLNVLAQAVSGDNQLDVRLAAARSLRTYKDPVAVRALGMALDENDAAMQFVAMDSLKSASGKDYGQSLAAWKEYVQGGDPAPPAPPSIAQQIQQWWYW
jgi:HEAT repeat protein